MELRQYQQEAIDAVNNKGPGKWLVVLFTGAGKSIVSTRFKTKGRMLILIHTIDLVQQNASYFKNCGIESGSFHSNGEDIIVSTWQSMKNRLDKFPPDYFDIVQLDEAHRSASKEYTAVIQHFKPRQLIGLTATPNRADGVGLGSLFDEIVYEKDLRFGIENGYLSKLKCRRVDIKTDLSSIAQSMGDYSAKELTKVMGIQGANKIIAKTVSEVEKPCLVFACSIEHAEKIQQLIPNSVVAHGKTKDRTEVLQEFRDGKIDTLISINILLEGFDAPKTRTVVMARPTKSTTLYTQVVGRVLRLSEGKEYGTIVDMVGNTKDNDLCSAATLLGYDLEGVPSSLIEDLEGDLFDLPEMIEKIYDTPEVYLKNDKMVDLFRRKHKVSLRDLFFIAMPSGELVLPLSRGRWIGIEPIDSIGETRVITNLRVPTGQRRPAQEVIDRIFTFLKERTDENMSHLRKSRKSGQKKKPASQAQRSLCIGLLKKNNETFDVSNLTMYEASTLISRLKTNMRNRDGR